MVILNDIQQAEHYSGRTLDFLSHHHLSPIPINYYVIYCYINKENHQLKLAIEKQLSSGKPIDNIFIEHLYNQHLSTTSQLEQLLLTPFESTLTKTLTKIDSQVDNENEIAESLKKVDHALTKLTQYQPLKTLINFILTLINNSQGQRKSLTNELTQTYAEVKLLRSQLAQSRKEASQDSLTGLLNRRGCEAQIKQFDLSVTHSTIAIDIDHFKQINDTFGHAIGDKVIQLIANIIKKSISADDIAARFGGEEFIVVMQNKSTDIAENIAEKIRCSVANLKLMQKQTKTYLPPISVSLGVAELTNQQTWAELFEKADQAMYQAKNLGRNRCIVAHSESMTPA